MCGTLMIGTLDHLKIQPIDGRPFIFSHPIITCIKTVSLKRSVSASWDGFFELQSIIQKYYNKFDSYQELIQRFICI